MGLDMYLKAEFYLSPYDDEHRELRTCINGLLNLGDAVATEVAVRVAYWRKANAIHAWFIAHCAKDVDDCRPVDVSKYDLQELLVTCEHVLAARPSPDGAIIAEEELPTQNGFFFGDTEYDEYYYTNVTDTIAACKKALAYAEHKNFCSFIYQASW